MEVEKRDVNVPKGGYDGVADSEKIGNLLNNIRTGRTTAPREFMDYILGKGFDLNRADAEHQRRWAWCTERIEFVVEVKKRDVNVPRDGYDGVADSEKIGTLLSSIRTGNTTAPREFMDYILANGMILNCQNLALHFAKLHLYHRRQRQWEKGEKNSTLVKDMPSTGGELNEDWVTEFQTTHDKLRGIAGGQRVPFGKRKLSKEAIQQRYERDLRRCV